MKLLEHSCVQLFLRAAFCVKILNLLFWKKSQIKSVVKQIFELLRGVYDECSFAVFALYSNRSFHVVVFF